MSINNNEHNLQNGSNLSRKEAQKIIRERLDKINSEFSTTFDFIKDFPKSVTFFGSARLSEDSDLYKKARSLAFKISKELGYTVLSGGGGGIMEASNRGAYEAGGESVGLNITLPREQHINKYTTKSIELHHFFVRKVALAFAAEAYIFFPGGFGTMDEFTEILTLIQTKKIPQVPIILVGRDYWAHLNTFIREVLLKEYNFINKEDMNLYQILDSEEEIIEIIKNAPIRDNIKFRETKK